MYIYLPEMLGLDQEICSSSFQKQLTYMNKGNNKITELRTILQRESQNL